MKWLLGILFSVRVFAGEPIISIYDSPSVRGGKVIEVIMPSGDRLVNNLKPGEKVNYDAILDWIEEYESAK